MYWGKDIRASEPDESLRKEFLISIPDEGQTEENDALQDRLVTNDETYELAV